MDSNLVGRIRNTRLPASHALMPLYEAVVNAIHAIEVLPCGMQNGHILVEIEREPMLDGDLHLGDITGFKITDNGIGFDDDNLKSFRELDSTFKEKLGCKGVGRLLWLKAFERVDISSRYHSTNGKIRERNFKFTLPNGVSEPEEADTNGGMPSGTEVHLSGFKRHYRDNCRKGTEIIARSILEHCLWFGIRPGGMPKVIVKDESAQYDLDALRDTYMQTNSNPVAFFVKGQKFEIVHVRVMPSVAKTHTLSYCAGTRQVISDKLDGAIPGLYEELEDESGKFRYAGYVASTYLDNHVSSERTGFDFPEQNPSNDLFESQSISLEEIRTKALSLVMDHLAEYTRKNEQASSKRLNDFVENNAPQYRPVIQRFKDKRKPISPNITNKDLHVMLHKELVELEEEMISAGHEVMSPSAPGTKEDYIQKVDEYLKIVSEIRQSDLAQYVVHRRVILELLRYSLTIKDNGRYATEDLIHNLIMPKGKTSDDILGQHCNLWVIDERLTFHTYLASDKTFSAMPITDSKSTKEPDILSLKAFPASFSENKNPPYGSVSVIEFKRPMRDDAKPGDNPVQQAINYLERIRNGKVQTPQGRPIPASKELLGFCYIICDVLHTMEATARLYSLSKTPDNMGYYGYHPGYNAWIEIISYDKLLKDAMERNHAFFQALGIPSTEL